MLGRKYLAVARTQMLASLVYERDLLVRSVFMVVALVTFVQLWTSTYDSTGQATVAGFSLSDLVWYLVVTETVALSTPRIVQIIDQEVRAGDVAYTLARPMSYPLYHLAGFWGETLVRLPVNALLGSVVALLAVGPPAVSPAVVLPTLLVSAAAITLKGSFEVLIGLSAFWFEDTLPVEWIYGKFLLTLGGTFLPLDLFPAWLGSLARALPFASMAYAPARTFVSFSWDVFGVLLLGQLVWVGLAWLLVSLVFARARRRIVAHGG
jgi:ABC-2 type transport system permease protein